MDFTLNPVEVRVLGALLEKEMTTPDYYPMTLNALVNACNQKSNREPVVTYDDDTVEEALETLRPKRLVMKLTTSAGGRAIKYSQRFTETFNLGRREQALLCVLMLRGPQTLGELHARTERMHDFTDLAEVEAQLERLMAREPEPLVVKLARQPGTKEPRYGHLLGGPVDAAAFAVAEPPPRVSTNLEPRVAALEAEVAELKRQFADFRKQFE